MSKYLTIVDDDNQHLLLVCGHPGSGKSELSKFYSRLTGADYFENDAFFTNEKGEYNFRIEDHQKAKDECLRQTKEALESGRSVVVANTFTTLAEMKPYLDVAESLKLPVRVVEMELTEFDSVHNVPQSVIKDKIKKFEPYEGAVRVTSKDYELHSIEDKGGFKDLLWNMDARYNFAYSTPKTFVKEILDDLETIIKFSKNAVEKAREEGDLEHLSNEIEDLNSYLNLQKTLFLGDLKAVKKTIRSMDTALREVLPLHILFLSQDNNPYALWNDLDAKRKDVLKVIGVYEENPKNATDLDERFTKDFFNGLISVWDISNSNRNTPGL